MSVVLAEPDSGAAGGRGLAPGQPRAAQPHRFTRAPGADPIPRYARAPRRHQGQELALARGWRRGAHAVAESPGQADLVVPLAMEHDLRTVRGPRAEPVHERRIGLERPGAMPIGHDQERWPNAAPDAQRPEPGDPVRQRGRDVMDGDEQAHRARMSR